MKRIILILLLAVLSALCVFLVKSHLDIKTEIEPDSGEPAVKEIVESVEPKLSSASAETPEPTSATTPEPTPDPYTYDDILADITTDCSGSSDARLSNIRLAVEKINGTVVLPGEVFSFLNALGQVAEDTGYQTAMVYCDNYEDSKSILELGGGISQLASNIYCAALFSRQTVVEHSAHYYPVMYIDRGRDAYVSADPDKCKTDMKFSNPLEDPVKMNIWLDDSDNKLHVQIHGTNRDGCRADIWRETYSIYHPVYTDVCIKYETRTYRNIFGPDGSFSYSENINIDSDGDGHINYDVYNWHECDYVWTS